MTRSHFKHTRLLLVAISCGLGCQRDAPQTQPTKSAPVQDPAEQTFPLTGVVRRVDREAGVLTLRHDEIPGYMPAMTMPFAMRDRAQLDDLQVGDHVKAMLVLRGLQSELAELAVTEWADSGVQADTQGAAALLKPGDLVPDLRVTTQDGKTLRLSALQGDVVVFTFIYTRCPLPDYCPAVDRKFAELARRVKLLGPDADRVRLLSISFDPEHDTPEALAKHARIVGAQSPLWTFCVASHDELQRVAPALGLSYGPAENEIIHTLSTAVVEPNGRLAALELGKGWTVDAVFSAVRRALRTRE